MANRLTEIPLPARLVAPLLDGAAHRQSAAALPAFVAGPENRLVAATFGKLLDTTCNTTTAARLTPSVLALIGPSGTGKTHLVHGLVRHWQQHRGAESAAYVTAADFRRQYLEALRANLVVDFRRRFRDLQLLAIDDLHQLPAEQHLQQELRYTLDEYEDQGGTIVVTAHRPMRVIPGLSPDLQSRLASGLTIQLAAPGIAARLRIIRHTSAAIGRPLSDEAARRLAAGVNGTATDVVGALFALCSAPAEDGASDELCAERLLASRSARRPTVREIIAVVARCTGVRQKMLKSGSRRQSTVLARAVVVYLARELAGVSYHQIGRALGGRDHTTIMHNYRKIDRDRLHDPTIQESLDELRRILLSR